MLAAADKRAELPSKALLVGDGLTVFDLLISARAHPVGVALTDRASGPRTRTLLRLLEVPSIVGVQGLFRWASDGDVALLDADHGLFIINPSKSEMASLREYKRARNSIAPTPPDAHDRAHDHAKSHAHDHPQNQAQNHDRNQAHGHAKPSGHHESKNRDE
jgi:phosphotransferase system enzyme I (PtsP)